MHLQIARIEFLDSPPLIQVVEKVAQAMFLAEMIRMIPFDFRYRLIRIPKNICDQHNLNPNNLWNRNSGRPNSDLFDAVLE